MWQDLFYKWIDDAIASSPPSEIIAFNVNLYDSPFRADLIGAASYDSNDTDWACEEDWEPKERFFEFPEELSNLPWEERLELVKSALNSLISSNRISSSRFRSSKALAVGFVDGELEIVYQGST